MIMNDLHIKDGSTMNYRYQVFGSISSKDYDIMVFVDSMPNTIAERHTIINTFNLELSKVFTDKPANANMCILKNGTVQTTFKGAEDEVNNAMMVTYSYHDDIQKHSNSIMAMVNRDIDLKMLRTFRIILTFLSKSKWKADVRNALRGTLLDKILVLQKLIPFVQNNICLGNKKVSHDDFFKTLAFQSGQLLGLCSGLQLYAKEDIAKVYPGFENVLSRRQLNDADIDYLRGKLQEVTLKGLHRNQQLLELNENTYKSRYVN